jgi:hypothetical protein
MAEAVKRLCNPLSSHHFMYQFLIESRARADALRLSSTLDHGPGNFPVC